MALVTVGFLLSPGRNNAEIAEAQTVKIDETIKNEIDMLCSNSKSIGSILDFPAAVPEASADAISEATMAEPEIQLKLSGMFSVQQRGLQTLTAEEEQAPEETEQADLGPADIEPGEKETYTDREKEMIAYVVYAEARGESFDGKVAVAQVVINRFESGKFGKSVKKVVYARHQFAVSRRYNDECMKAVEFAIDNMPHPKDMYYFQVSKRKKWRNFEYYSRIGNHSFYCAKGKN